MDPPTPPPNPELGTYVGGLSQVSRGSRPRTPPSTPLSATHAPLEDLPDCLAIRVPSTATSTFSAVRPYRVPVGYAPVSPQSPSIHDHKWIQRQPHHPSHRSLSPPPYPTKRIVDRLHIPAVLAREKQRYQHLILGSLMRDAGGLVDIDGEQMLVEERDREKVMELKRREARAKLEGWEWGRREEEKRAGMGHVRRPVGMGGSAEDAVAERPALKDGTVMPGQTQRLPGAEMEKRVLSRDATVPLERSAARPQAKNTSRAVPQTITESRPRLRGGDASQIPHTRDGLLDHTIAAETSHWSASTEASGCVPATRAESRSGIARTVSALRSKHQTSSSARCISLRRRHGKHASSRKVSKVQAEKSQFVVSATMAIPALPSRAFEDAISIVASSPGSSDVSIIQSREHQIRLDKPLPPLPGQGMASGERATSCVAVFDLVSPTILSADEEWPISQRSTPRVRLRKCKGRSNLLMDGLVDGYLATWCIAHT
ncbi:hypothetical protein B0A48_03547 [Cryoendolithus antarcticus]|uniref:Uncharacterized protein n=1 Tax=Cryoendolithus antarcticus TaxID=1507870 RepID=A0A1V8TKB1_9PEZI|nr:hypothetical protein B0A48_03547 [Cryoendolithus antarcticus]